MGRVPFNGELLYTIAPFGVFSRVGEGVGMGVSLGKNHAGILLILFGVGGVIHKEDKKEELSASYNPPSLRDCEIEVSSRDEPYPPPLQTPRVTPPRKDGKTAS
jgi:hypothetical protein